MQQSPSGTVVERNNLEEKLQTLTKGIRQETTKKLEDELGIFQRQNQLLKFEFQTALEEQTARVVLVGNTMTDATKV